MKKIIPSTLVTILCLWVQPAIAYIDPGSGSAIMSAVIGFFVAAGLIIKTYWYKLKSIFTSKKQTSKINNDKNSEAEK